MAHRFPTIPKVKEYAELTLSDGSVMQGYLFVEATMRIQDVLNGDLPFFAFIDEEERLYLLNKASIIKVRPFDR